VLHTVRSEDLAQKAEDLEQLVDSEKALRVKAEERSTSLLTRLQDEQHK